MAGKGEALGNQSLTDEERMLLPFRYVGGRDGEPRARLRGWVEEREGVLKPTYLVVDDPTYWIKLARPS